MEMEDFFLRLPVELTTEILSVLDTDSVIECKHVSKTWQSLIDDPYFIGLHTNRLISSVASASASDSPVLNFVWKHVMEHELQFGDYEDEQQVFCPIRTNEFYPHWLNWEIIGSCNGLVCLSKPLTRDAVADDVYVCNPFTREYLNLPKDSDHRPYVTIGFGHDSVTNEYKVVRLYEPASGYPRQIKVYILGNGKWRRSKNENEIIPSFPKLMIGRGISSRRKSGLLLNGALYWSIGDLNIISFDLANEEFEIIPLPNGWSQVIPGAFGVVGGCFFAYEMVKYDKCTNVWVLDNGTSSWIKNAVPWEDLMNYGSVPFAFLSNGKILSWSTGHSSPVLSYDTKTGRFDHITRRKCMVGRQINIPYMKSIVSLNKLGEKDAIYSKTGEPKCKCFRTRIHPLFHRFFQ